MLAPATARQRLEEYAAQAAQASLQPPIHPAPEGPELPRWYYHSRQVARLARQLSEALLAAAPSASACSSAASELLAGLNPEVCETTALLHDLGRCRTHGPFHGWTGFCILRAHGQADSGRGCLSHWLKGRQPQELVATMQLSPAFVARVYAQLQPPAWTLADSVMSFADSSVAGSRVVSLQQRHADLQRRYGASPWLTRHAELAQQHALQISELLGHPVGEWLSSLHTD